MGEGPEEMAKARTEGSRWGQNIHCKVMFLVSTGCLAISCVRKPQSSPSTAQSLTGVFVS